MMMKKFNRIRSSEDNLVACLEYRITFNYAVENMDRKTYRTEVI